MSKRNYVDELDHLLQRGTSKQLKAYMADMVWEPHHQNHYCWSSTPTCTSCILMKYLAQQIVTLRRADLLQCWIVLNYFSGQGALIVLICEADWVEGIAVFQDPQFVLETALGVTPLPTHVVTHLILQTQTPTTTLLPFCASTQAIDALNLGTDPQPTQHCRQNCIRTWHQRRTQILQEALSLPELTTLVLQYLSATHMIRHP